jgi:site-specific DNA recombinase
MNIAIYTRVSTIIQAQQQTIQTQLSRLEEYLSQKGIEWEKALIYQDEGISGATLRRPALSKLRDSIRQREITQLYLTAPDRLARKYVHQALLLEEFEQAGCDVTFIDRPMTDDPNDQLLLQIRGAVAEYERSLIADRMRQGRERQYKAGKLLPWTRTPYGYDADPDNPRDPAGLHINEIEANHLREMFTWYTQSDHTLYGLAEHLKELGIPSPSGRAYWNKG